MLVPVAALSLLLAAGSAPAAGTPAETADGAEQPSLTLRDELESVVRRAADDLFHERNESGERFRRASYSKRFRPAGENRWATDYTVDTARGETMLTERYRVVLARPGGKKWEIVEQELQDTWERLVRDLPGNERFLRFDRFELDREGLGLSASNGTMFVDELLGEVESIELAADDIEWSWAPPRALGPSAAGHWAYVRSAYAERLEFDAGRIRIRCDAATCAELLAQAFRGVAPIEEADLHERLRKRYRESIAEEEAALRSDPFAGFRLPPRAEHRHWRAAAIAATDDDDWVAVAYDNERGRQVTVSAGGFGVLYEHPDEQTRSLGQSAEAIERRPDSLETYDVLAVRGTVELAVEHSELIESDLEFIMRARRDLDEIWFGLADLSNARGSGSTDREPALTIDRLEDGSGQPLTWARLGRSGALIRFPEVIHQDEILRIRMAFRNEGSLIKHSPSYTYVDRDGWLPFVRYTDTIDELDLTLRVPSRFEALGVGNKVSERKRGNVTETRWLASGVHFPTVIFGDYVEDRPRSKAEKSDGREIPVAIHVDRTGMEDWQIRPGQLRPLAEQAVNALNLYREIFGVDYPYEKLDLVNDPLGGLYGQSPGSIVYLGSPAFRGEGILGSVAGSGATRFTKSLVAHEVGHQWWGSLIGNANMRNYWFVESLAEYSSALFLEALSSAQEGSPEKGYKAYLDHVADWRREILEREPLASVKDARVTWSGGGYRSALYAKGPYAFHMLRTIFGDEAMFAFLKTLGRELAGGTIVTSDIERVAGQSFGTDMQWFFDQWIRGIGIPEYSIDYATRRAEDGTWIVSGRVRQAVLFGPSEMRLPATYFRAVVPITVVGKDRQEYTTRLIVEEEETEFAFKVPVEPKSITLNRNGETLARDVVDETRM